MFELTPSNWSIYCRVFDIDNDDDDDDGDGDSAVSRK
jgi:hypothetical protein